MMATEKRLIDANELMEQIRYYDKREQNELWETSDIEYAVAEQPTVDAVEVVHGEWVDRYARKYANPSYECSECRGVALYKAEVDELWHKKFVQVLSDYCPHCGAKMDGDGK